LREELSGSQLLNNEDVLGDKTRWRTFLIDHFQNRASPRFFVSVREIKLLREYVSEEDPEFRAAILNHAREEARERYKVYAHRYSGLASGFRFDGVALGNGGDDLYIERPQRFAFAASLGLASLWDRSAVHILSRTIEEWMDYSQSERSLAYASNLVVLYRILALHWTFFFVSASTELERDRAEEEVLLYNILKIIHADARFFAERAGGSVANNHLLADGFGLWYLGQQFPEFRDARQWEEDGETLWLGELDRQIYADGASFEHSVHYHELACEMALTYLILSHRNARSVPEWALLRIREMCAFQASCSGPYDAPHYLGDTVEDPLIPLDLPGTPGASTLRRIHDRLYPPLFQSRVGSGSNRGRALWLLSPAETIARATDNRRDGEIYPRGGYFFLSDGGARLLFRTGPAPGESVFAGHMHYDFLTVYLTVENDPLIVEAGTYTYRSNARTPHGPPAGWRAYLMGAESHNGLVIDEPDPLGFAGDFRNARSPARVSSSWITGSNVLAWVEGRVEQAANYSGHCRGVVHVPGEYFVIYDTLAEEQVRRSPRLHFQLACGATLDPIQRGTAIVRRGHRTVTFGYSENHVRPSIVEGGGPSPAGWASERYGELQSSPSLLFELGPDVDANALVLTAEVVGQTMKLDVTKTDRGLATRIVHPEAVDVLLVNTSSLDSVLRAGDIEFAGRVAWVRTLRNGRTEVRALDACRLSDGKLEISSEGGKRSKAIHVVYDSQGFETLVGDADRTRIRLV
jgi:hypothetical protein